MKFSATVLLLLSIFLPDVTFSQEICSKTLTDRPIIINFEGKFINAQKSRTSLSVEWRHHPEATDSFFVSLPDRDAVTYVTTPDYRFIEIGASRIKRQMAEHHLRESIGNTPIKFDDLELLAHGFFKCPDSSTTDSSASIQSNKVYSTALSNTWWSIITDSLEHPKEVSMKGVFKQRRNISIEQWKEFSGIMLPSIVSLAGEGYRGYIWIRSSYTFNELENDPLQASIRKSGQRKFQFPWNGKEK